MNFEGEADVVRFISAIFVFYGIKIVARMAKKIFSYFFTAIVWVFNFFCVVVIYYLIRNPNFTKSIIYFLKNWKDISNK